MRWTMSLMSLSRLPCSLSLRNVSFTVRPRVGQTDFSSMLPKFPGCSTLLMSGTSPEAGRKEHSNLIVACQSRLSSG